MERAILSTGEIDDWRKKREKWRNSYHKKKSPNKKPNESNNDVIIPVVNIKLEVQPIFKEYNIFSNDTFSISNMLINEHFNEIKAFLTSIKFGNIESMDDRLINIIETNCSADISDIVIPPHENIKFSTTMIEYVFHCIVVNEISFDINGRVFNRLLFANSKKLRLSSILLQRIKLNDDLSQSETNTCYTSFVQKHNLSKWICAAKIVKCLIRFSKIDFDFDKYNLYRCLPLNLHSLFEDDISYYTKSWTMNDTDVSHDNYNRFFAALCYLKYLIYVV